MYLIGNGRLVTRDPQHPYFRSGGVVTQGETILAAGDYETLRQQYPEAEFVDARGGVIMPGLINAHSHIYSALARGLSVTGHDPEDFLAVLQGMWWKLDRKLTREGARLSAYATYLDCIKQGVTTLFDHHASYGEIRGSLEEIAEVARELGVRTSLCYEVSDRDGPEKCAQAIEENAAFIASAQDGDPRMVGAMFGLHAPFTLSDPTLERCAEANAGRAGFHIHVAEGMLDVYDSLRNYGIPAVERLLHKGILGEKTILGHCIHITKAEMRIIRETGSMVVNNPESNMGNAVGCSPVLELFKEGILVGLGTDAYTNDMLESLKVALAIQRHNACLPNVGWGEATSMLFRNNPEIVRRLLDVQVGVLAPGAAADVVVMDYKPFTPFDGNNVDGHILFGMTGRQCETTMINGKLRMLNRELVGVDEERLNARIQEGAEALWRGVNG